MRGNASDPSPHFGRRGPGAIGRGVGGAYGIGVAERSRSAADGIHEYKESTSDPSRWILMLGLYTISKCILRTLRSHELMLRHRLGLGCATSLTRLRFTGKIIQEELQARWRFRILRKLRNAVLF
jgi:hypothetical protein